MCGASTSRNKPRCRSWCSNSRQKKSHFVFKTFIASKRTTVCSISDASCLSECTAEQWCLSDNTGYTAWSRWDLFVRSSCSTGKIVPCIENQLMKTSTTNGRHLFHGLDRGVGKTVCQHSGVSIPQLICQSFLRWHNIFTAMSSLLCKLFTYTLSAKTLFTTQTFKKKKEPQTTSLSL